ncbi:MAG: YbaB/EbfC family nucleoid-associated protein [Pirellulales bacterium]|nr:YbaB/EbfC family nucleoid-associated protein [Pirellulales bacterium]
MGGRLQGLSEELKAKRVTGSAGGGMVEVEANGTAEILNCRIDPQLFEQQDRELIEDLVVTATNQALSKAKQLHAEAMQALTGNINIPGLDEAMNKFMGQPPSDDEPKSPPEETEVQ